MTAEVGSYSSQLVLMAEARGMLDQARTVSEVLEVLQIAAAARAYARARDLGVDARNYAAEIVMRAQRRLGEILTTEIRSPEQGRPKEASQTTTLSDLKVTRDQSSRAQKMAGIPAPVFDRHITRVIDAGNDLTAAGLLRARNGTTVIGSESNEWYTPAIYVDAARRVLGGIDLDPASCEDGNETVRAAQYYSIDEDGMTLPWKGRVWLNPPYGRLAGVFLTRLVDEFLAGRVLSAVVLVNAHCTDTRWFQPLFNHTLCFTDHRIDFAAGTPDRSGSTHGSVFAYLGPDPSAFEANFCHFGAVVRRWPS